MAWVAEEKFDSYSNNVQIVGLNGGSGWNAAWIDSTTWVTTNTTTYQGAEAVLAGSNTGVERVLTSSTTSGVLYFAMRAGQTNGAGVALTLRKSGGNGLYWINFDATNGGSTGNITLTGTTTVTLVTGYSANTWYVIRLTYGAGNTATAAVSTAAFQSGGSFGSDSSSVTAANSGGAVVQLNLQAENFGASTYYYDYISGTNPLTAPPAVTTGDFLPFF